MADAGSGWAAAGLGGQQALGRQAEGQHDARPAGQRELDGDGDDLAEARRQRDVADGAGGQAGDAVVGEGVDQGAQRGHQVADEQLLLHRRGGAVLGLAAAAEQQVGEGDGVRAGDQQQPGVGQAAGERGPHGSGAGDLDERGPAHPGARGDDVAAAGQAHQQPHPRSGGDDARDQPAGARGHRQRAREVEEAGGAHACPSSSRCGERMVRRDHVGNHPGGPPGMVRGRQCPADSSAFSSDFFSLAGAGAGSARVAAAGTAAAAAGAGASSALGASTTISTRRFAA